MRTHSYTHHTVTVHEHRFDVPVNHSLSISENNPTIELFARELVREGGEKLPYMVFLQGGPGGSSPRQGDWREGWIGRALKDYRVVLMDQRGTGQSTRLDSQSLATFATDQDKADYIMNFRQDQIVADAEFIRHHLSPEEPWTTAGQSYGGFITTSYLSLAPEGVKASIITGGLPGLTHIDDIYRDTYQATAVRNQYYFNLYPQDQLVIRQICAHLRDTEEFLPSGERLTTQRLRSVGMNLGGQLRTDMLHYLFEGPWVSVKGERRLSEKFLSQIAAEVEFSPMYGYMHESIYAGATPSLVGTATQWSADRLSNETPGFIQDADPLDMSEPYYLTGEHMMRSFFEEVPSLKPLLGATDILASRTDWNPVYLPEVLAQTTSPVVAAVYYGDMFVPRELSVQTADLIGARTWITNEFQHDGLRASGTRVWNRLLDMLADPDA